MRDLPNVDVPEPVAADEYQPRDDGVTTTPNAEYGRAAVSTTLTVVDR